MAKLKSSLEAKGAMDYRTFEQKLLDTIFHDGCPAEPRHDRLLIQADGAASFRSASAGGGERAAQH